MDSILSEVVHLNKVLVLELQNDLLVLINKHFFIQVSSHAPFMSTIVSLYMQVKDVTGFAE